MLYLVLNKKLRRVCGGLGLITVLSLFLHTVAYAADYPSFGPQTYQNHKYYYFGDGTYSKTSRQGIDISVDGSSVSYQSVKATVTMDWNLIMDRGITKFVVLANGVNVDEFEPYFDYSVSPPVYKEYYYLDINVSDQYIGSDVYFQVVALHQDNINTTNGNVWTVGWSQESPTFRLKPLPVTDSDTHGWLQAIYELLEQIKAKLEEIKTLIENLFTPSPQAEQRLDNAINNLLEKMPMQKMAEQMDETNEELQRTLSQLEQPHSRLTLGGKIHFLYDENGNSIDGEGYDFIDLTEYREQVRTFRIIEEAAIWVFFIYGLIRMLTPKATV
ncbi:hypothetical protein [Paenibacillus sp. SI8]|uniref:hypothetical protein n=1 Tax=unclassified Paenibacillus TaxID=185978 RepID=UPI003467DDF6